MNLTLKEALEKHESTAVIDVYRRAFFYSTRAYKNNLRAGTNLYTIEQIQAALAEMAAEPSVMDKYMLVLRGRRDADTPQERDDAEAAIRVALAGREVPEGCLWAVTKGGHSLCQPPKKMFREGEISPAQPPVDVNARLLAALKNMVRDFSGRYSFTVEEAKLAIARAESSQAQEPAKQPTDIKHDTVAGFLRGCTRSHPHEDMSPECEARTVEARTANLVAQEQSEKVCGHNRREIRAGREYCVGCGALL